MRLAIARPSDAAERKSLYMKLVEATVVYAILFFFALLVGIPFLYMITGSFKTNGQLFSWPVNLLAPEPTMNNYERLLSGEEIPYLRQMGNSVVIAVSQSALTLLFASMVGWGFAKYEFRGKTFLTIFLLFTFAMPTSSPSTSAKNVIFPSRSYADFERLIQTSSGKASSSS